MAAISELPQVSGTSVEATTIASAFVEHETPTSTIAELEARIAWGKFQARVLLEDTNEIHGEFERLHDRSLDQLLRHRTSEKAKRDVRVTLTELADRGFAWSAIARIVGVSVPALRKWRQGDSVSGENRRRLAEFAAACDMIVDRNPMTQDVAGWLEMPLSGLAPLSGLDILAAHRFDLIFRYSDGDVDPEAILDEFRPSWREQYSSEIEVFTAEDGQPALRMRSGD